MPLPQSLVTPRPLPSLPEILGGDVLAIPAHLAPVHTEATLTAWPGATRGSLSQDPHAVLRRTHVPLGSCSL